jgi:hypothetical protein
MKLTPTKIKELLAQELANKKSYAAHRDTFCDICAEDIPEGEDFIFMGEKKKICNVCFGEITTFLEE